MSQTALADRIDISRGYMSLLVNGEREPSTAILKKIAEALSVPVGDLFATPEGHPSDSPTPPGFSDTGAGISQYLPPNDRQKTKLKNLMAILCPDARNPTAYRLPCAYPGLMLVPGDLLIVDQHATPKNGDIVMVRAANEHTGSGETRLKIHQDGGLITPFAAPYTDGPDDVQAGYGTVIATIRSALFT